MARLRRKRKDDAELDLDSLMDILTCSIGVMVAVVLVAVLDARSAAINVTLPMAQDPPEASTRKVMLCSDGQLRPFEFGRALEVLVGEGRITFEGLPRRVAQANEAEVTDGFFDYRFEMGERRRGLQIFRSADLIAEPRTGARPFRLEELEEDPSRFLDKLEALRAEGPIWVAFLVDEESIPLFRKARELVASRGIPSGWDPGRPRFPHRETVLGGEPGTTGGPGFLDKITNP